MLEVRDLELTYGHQVLFEEVNWKVNPGERVALVGKNGAGKSTLLKILAGLVAPDEGDVIRMGNTSVGYLEQDSDLHPEKTVWEEALEGKEEILALEDELRKYEHLISELDPDSPDMERRLNRYSQLQHEFEEKGGYQAESDAGAVLNGLGFPKDRWEEPIGNWSGGWQVRLRLAKLLISKPDVLLLDEPTNYLDLENIVWIENLIKDHPGAVVIVSHDRALLNRITTRVSEVGMKTVSEYKGNYDYYLAERELRYELIENAAKNQQREIRQNEQFIRRFKSKSTKAAQARSRMKRLEKMDVIELPREDRKVRVILPKAPRGGKEVVRMKDLSHAYNGVPLFKPVNLNLYRGERIALVGRNGAGKTTLMKLIQGELNPSQGKAEIGQSITPRYFAQDQIASLNPRATVLAEAESEAPDEWRSRVRDLLAAFLFRGDDVLKPTGVLSGGEKSRLCLARILCGTANFLILDEPTNHLDLVTKQRLLDALLQYEGTILFVSHDRYFLKGLATRLIEIEDGEVTDYPWGYEDYLTYKEEMESP